MNVIWGDDQRYWSWTECEGSRFPEVAYLIQVCWLEIRGGMQCFLPPGTYNVSWRLSFSTNDFQGFNYKPVNFSVEGPNHVPVHVKRDLTAHGKAVGERGKPPLWTWSRDNKWVELNVGEFTVEELDSPVGIKFAMVDIDGGYWKSGMFLDSVLIRPSAARATNRN
ncbi:unnamed protein product [Calypogeia fissa]